MIRLLRIAACMLAAGSALMLDAPQSGASEAEIKKVAAIVTVYTPDSHADVIVTRLLETETLDGRGRQPKLRLASLYVDQTPARDISRGLAAKHKFPIVPNVEAALTLGTGKLAVDGVLLVCEMGDYPVSSVGQVQYPKRKFFEAIAKVMAASGRVVPVFVDKHLADNWDDAKAIYDTAQRMKIPLMAGSSLPVLWRYPAIDTERDRPLKELVAVSFHSLDGYGFHGMEMVQCLAERRAGGETGVKSVQCLVDDQVWEAGERGLYDPKLLDATLARVLWRPYNNPDLRKNVAHPVLWMIRYRDGLKASVLTLNYAVGQWAASWRYEDDAQLHSTLFWTQEARPFMHFTYLVAGIEQMMFTGKATWPAERTLLTSGTLDALLISKANGGKTIETPQLGVSYRSDWEWRQPPKSPPPYLYFPK